MPLSREVDCRRRREPWIHHPTITGTRRARMSSLPPLVLDSEEGRQLQQLIKRELARRQWSDGDDDEVMAEYILVMLANNKTADQIANELEELVGDSNAESSGSESVKVFVDWLFAERAAVSINSDHLIDSQSVTASSGTRSREQWRTNETKRRSLSPNRAAIRDEGVAIPAGFNNDIRRNQRGEGRWGDDRRHQQSDHGSAFPNPHPRNARRQADPNTHTHLRNEGKELLNGHSGNNVNHAAMDDPSLHSATGERKLLRIMGQGGNQLFQKSLQNTNRLQQTPPLSIFSRVSVPDPRAQEFVPSEQLPPQEQISDGNLFSRLDPMVPWNQLPSSITVNDSLTAMHDSTFPSKPTDASLCRYSLRCTNPMCCFSHPSASAVSQHQKTGKEPLVLRQEPCRFQRDCTNAECSFSHVSPAVTFVLAKTERRVDALGNSTSSPAATACHFQMQCKNPACTYAHYDPATGQVVPGPALQSSATASEALSTENTPCRFGHECTRRGCHFSHPPGHSLHISDRLSQFGGGGSNQMDGEMEVIIPASS